MHKKSPQNKLTRPARISGIVATAIAVIVMLGTGLILSPTGTPLRAEVRSIALPYFGQTWRVFAPNILKTDRTLEIRAQWRDESDELVTSGWVPITEIEQRTVTGNLAPSRIQKSSWNAVGTLLTRYNALDDEQRGRVRDTFIQAEDGAFSAIPVEQLIEELGTGDSDVIRYLRMDYMLMRYATAYATAGFGEQIERVQWRVVRDRPNDFTHRFDETRQFEPVLTTFGWRQVTVELEPSVVNEYAALIERYSAHDWFQEAADVAE